MKKNECPECGSSNIVVKEDTTICNDCGAISEKLAPEEEKKFEKARDQ